MTKNRLYDIIGAVIATIVATIIINQFSSFVDIANTTISTPLYLSILIASILMFVSVVLTTFFLDVKMNKAVEVKDSVIQALKSQLKSLSDSILHLEEIAALDQLTNTYNSNQLERVLAERMEQAIKENSTFAIIFIDIDNFKRINDSYNHVTGNLVLKQVAEILKPRSKDDSLIRYGGDEFIIISKVGDDINSGYGFAERVRKEIASNKFIVDYNSTIRESLTISCGVTAFSEARSTKEIMLQNVTDALSRAKAKKEDGSEKNFVHVVVPNHPLQP